MILFNYIDLIILAFIVLGAIAGFKKGFFSQTVSFIGVIIIIAVAFTFKDDLAKVLFTYMPFFKFAGEFKNLTVLNVLLYEIVSFLILFIALGIVLKIILVATSILEYLIKFTVILGLPFKMLGAVVGAAQGLLWAFIIVMFLNQPTIAPKAIEESKLGTKMLTNLPFMAKQADGIVEIANITYELKGKYGKTDTDAYNLEVLDAMLKYKIVSVDSVQMLLDRNKLTFPGIAKTITKYKK